MQRSGVNLACAKDQEWIQALEVLMTDQESRCKAGELGKAYAEEYFSEEAIIARWDDLFASLGFDFRTIPPTMI